MGTWWKPSWLRGRRASSPLCPRPKESRNPWRGSCRRGGPAAHLLLVLSHRLGLTLWPQAVADKTIEIPVLEGDPHCPEHGQPPTALCIKISSVASSKQPWIMGGVRRPRLTASRSSWRRGVRLQPPTAPHQAVGRARRPGDAPQGAVAWLHARGTLGAHGGEDSVPHPR
jgi:hypothetical protein